MPSFRRVLMILAVCAWMASSAQAETQTKFGAWASQWFDAPFPLIYHGLDPRFERLTLSSCSSATDNPVVTCGAVDRFVGVANFAAAHKPLPGHASHIYTTGDEPNCNGQAAADVALYFREFALAIRAQDPNARFASPAFCDPGGGFEGYAADFATAYYALGNGGTPSPPITEWHVNIYDPDNWALAYERAAAFAVAHSGTAWITTGLIGVPNQVNVLSKMGQMLQTLQSDARVSYVVWYGYDAAVDPEHTLINASGNLTPEGQLYATYALAPPSLPQNSLIAQADFTHDGYADYAERYLPTSEFYVQRNLHAPNVANHTWPFDGGPAPYLQGQTPNSPEWDVLVGDFDGDLYADYADVHVPSGQVWIHRYLTASSFDSNAWAFVDLHDNGSTPDYEILAGDVDGDGKADLIERQLSTGLVWVRHNEWQSHGTFPLLNEGVWSGSAVGLTFHGSDWRTVVADVLSDGKDSNDVPIHRVELIDQHLPSGQFWVHRLFPIPPLAGLTVPTNFTWHLSTRDEGFGDASDASPNSGWQTLFGDFNGDGRADFGDLHVASGTLWFHFNLSNGTFEPPGYPNAYMWFVNTGANWQIFASR
jgi:hypothetical protein